MLAAGIKKKKKLPVAVSSNNIHIEELNEEPGFIFAKTAFELLGEKCRQLLIMFYFKKEGYKKIAATLAFSDEKIAKNQKYRCLQKAKRKLHDLLKKTTTMINNSIQIAAVDAALNAEVIRIFAINKFGVWNCDHPQHPGFEVPLYSGFTDSLNNNLGFSTVSVVYKGFNGITQFVPSMPIRVMPMQENMIWSIMDSSFYYFSYKDFAAAGIQKETRSFNFRMRKADKQIRSYGEIRELMEKL